MRSLAAFVAAAVLAAILAACSTTKRLGPDETLYLSLIHISEPTRLL